MTVFRLITAASIAATSHSFLAPSFPKHTVVFSGLALDDSFPSDPFAGGLRPPPDVLASGLSRFLTQRAVQQQLYYYGLNLDETSATWLSEFMQRESTSVIQQEYHGIDALPTPDSGSFFCSLLAHTEVEVTVKALMGCAAGRGHGGINGATGLPITRNQNPYLKPRYREYQVTVRPTDMADKLLTIRANIAQELSQDAAFLVAEGETISTILRDAGRDVDISLFPTPESLVPLGFTPSEHTAEGGGRASPFRLANFDLFKLLSTKEALFALAASGERSSAEKLTREARQAVKAAESTRTGEHISKAAQKVFMEYLPTINSHSPWAQSMGKPSLADSILHSCACDGSADGVVLAQALVAARSSLVSSWAARALGEDLIDEQAAWRRWYLTRFFSFSTAGDGDERRL